MSLTTTSWPQHKLNCKSTALYIIDGKFIDSIIWSLYPSIGVLPVCTAVHLVKHLIPSNAGEQIPFEMSVIVQSGYLNHPLVLKGIMKWGFRLIYSIQPAEAGKMRVWRNHCFGMWGETHFSAQRSCRYSASHLPWALITTIFLTKCEISSFWVYLWMSLVLWTNHSAKTDSRLISHPRSGSLYYAKRLIIHCVLFLRAQ